MLKITKEFEKFSSLRANVENCEACWIGKAKKNKSKPVKCKWASLTKKSKPVYVSTVITVSHNFYETLQSLQKDFIWGGEKAKIKHSSLIGDYQLEPEGC